MNNRTLLRDSLHEKFVWNGEIGTIADSAKDIMEWMIDNEVEYSDSKVLSIWKQAANDFVDSMKANASDLYETEQEYLNECSKYEAMRPK